jgi:imidazole glycerol-phosphate synthase subunit HisH
MIAVIDYGMGNVRSMCNAVEWLGYEAALTADPKVIADASHVILPGVGAFGDAITNIKERGLDEILHQQVIEKGKPLLGVCLGLQLLAKRSEEHKLHDGLGLLDAEVIKFKFSDSNLKLPHVGWNVVSVCKDHQLFHKLKRDEFSFYFVHSFHIVCKNQEDVLATCDYGIEFVAAISKNAVVATQFHPEKSQDNGIQVLYNFLNWRP